ncbi:MAG: hypothetical protein QOE98_1959 [Gaiellaceae bacterium]|nr:hypothetical protein [Gaiellaceae bacterium]
MTKTFKYGGFIAAAVLIAFGAVAIFMGFNGRSTVQSSLKLEAITGSEGMNPATIAADAKKAGLPATIALPTCDVAGKAIDSGAAARCFASYIRIHALEASGGKTYSQLPRFATTDGAGTSDPTAALKDANGATVSNPARDQWITATALATALNVSYMADQLALFGIVVGVALLLTGIGFGVLAGGLLGRRERVASDVKVAVTASPIPSV